MDKENIVQFGPEHENDFIMNVESGKMVMKRKGGSFAFEAHFVQKLESGLTRQAR